MSYLDDDCGCGGNTGHGPGEHYGRPVGPKGAAFAWWLLVALIAGIGWLFGIGH